jgi:hypothetical protein
MRRSSAEFDPVLVRKGRGGDWMLGIGDWFKADKVNSMIFDFIMV